MSQPWKCVNFSLHERNLSLHESAWNFLFMKGNFLCMKVRELFSTWKKLFSAWKCMNFSVHERNFSLHESAWTFLYMKETFLCMKVREIFYTWKKLFFAWKCVSLKITLMHYNLSSMWFSIKDNTCLIMPTISPLWTRGQQYQITLPLWHQGQRADQDILFLCWPYSPWVPTEIFEWAPPLYMPRCTNLSMLLLSTCWVSTLLKCVVHASPDCRQDLQKDVLQEERWLIHHKRPSYH